VQPAAEMQDFVSAAKHAYFGMGENMFHSIQSIIVHTAPGHSRAKSVVLVTFVVA
jgi:hypothetical protein